MCRYVGHHTHWREEQVHSTSFKGNNRERFVNVAFALLPIQFSPSLPFALHHFFPLSHYCTATSLLCPPTLLLLFIILRWERCCYFSGFAAGSCSSQWADHDSCCRRLCSAPAAAAPSVIHCVVTLMIMDSARVFRLSAGSCSPRITLSLTCTQTRTDTHTYKGNKPACAWLHTCTCTHGCEHINAIHTSVVMMTFLLPLRCK